ncbi:MAG: hypothetical protein IJV15_12820 [Lachnospiraceae bacterium]|nr:hypothetical protein [Lachnospiraceae bacterium]
MNNSDYFNKALHDMVFENACGAAIRRLADMSFPVTYIHKQLDYPISCSQVQKYVWKYYIEKKVLLYKDNSISYHQENEYIILDEPHKEKTYIKEQGAYGKITYRQVTVNNDNISDSDSIKKYVPCDFGIIKHNNHEYYNKLLNKLYEQDRAYIDDLQWKNERVYHIMNERMTSIIVQLNKHGLTTTFEM